MQKALFAVAISARELEWFLANVEERKLDVPTVGEQGRKTAVIVAGQVKVSAMSVVEQVRLRKRINRN